MYRASHSQTKGYCVIDANGIPLVTNLSSFETAQEVATILTTTSIPTASVGLRYTDPQYVIESPKRHVITVASTHEIAKAAVMALRLIRNARYDSNEWQAAVARGYTVKGLYEWLGER